MVICYNRDKGIPNWVAWRVTKADLGQLDREDAFRRRPSAEGWTRITPNDYTGSGYDRGHVCPNADRYSSREAADSTFVMTNMTPQTGDLNRGPWQKLEAYLRTLVNRGSDIYIIAGVYGDKGKLKKKFRSRRMIGRSRSSFRQARRFLRLPIKRASSPLICRTSTASKTPIGKRIA